MKNTICTILALIFLVSVSHTQDHTNVDEKMKLFVSSNKMKGVSAAYSVAGETIWKEENGYSDDDGKIAFTSQTLTRTASIAKPMTAIAIMQLMEHEKLDIDDPLSKYVPGLPPSIADKITIRQLLGHTSGIGGYGSGDEAETTKEYATLKEAVELFKDRDLLFEPGTDFNYSTYGYVMLGRVIEEVSGLTYEEYLQKNIWDVAKMSNTGVEKYGVKYENKSSLFHCKKKKAKKAKQNNLSNRIPGGGFYSTVEDLMKFGNAILENKFISEKSLVRMCQSHGMKKEGNPYGMGWYLYGGKENPGALIGHSGEQTGCTTQLMIVPKLRTVVVVMSNTSGNFNEVIQYSIDFIPLANEAIAANK